jgi:hypothetical protein
MTGGIRANVDLRMPT